MIEFKFQREYALAISNGDVSKIENQFIDRMRFYGISEHKYPQVKIVIFHY